MIVIHYKLLNKIGIQKLILMQMNEEAYLPYIVECELINVERMRKLENHILLNLVVKFRIGMECLNGLKESFHK